MNKSEEKQMGIVLIFKHPFESTGKYYSERTPCRYYRIKNVHRSIGSSNIQSEIIS